MIIGLYGIKRMINHEVVKLSYHAFGIFGFFHPDLL